MIINKKNIIPAILISLVLAYSLIFYINRQNSVAHFQEANGKYSVDYPKNYIKTNSTSNTTTFSSSSISNIDTNVMYTITYTTTENGKTIDEMIKNNSWCTYLNEDETSGEKTRLGGNEAVIFKDTPCGPFGSTLIYTINDDKFYETKIESTRQYADIENEANTVLNTFRFRN